MRCMVCGNEMDNTLGGCYTCFHCGHSIHDGVYRPSNCDVPVPQGFGKQEGWICPVCGRGVAPWMSVCPCTSNSLEITCGTEMKNVEE